MDDDIHTPEFKQGLYIPQPVAGRVTFNKNQ